MHIYTEVKKSIYLSINLAPFIMYFSFSSSSEQHQQYALCQYRPVCYFPVNLSPCQTREKPHSSHQCWMESMPWGTPYETGQNL